MMSSPVAGPAGPAPKKAQTQETNYYVKVRPAGEKVFWFLTSSGGMNRLRVHATIFREEAHAKKVADEIRQDPENEGIEAKVVKQVFKKRPPRIGDF